jgi:Myotubularin-like phosphatase domain
MSGNGVDRSAVISSLVQLLLDPYYRTISGFQILVEKEWLSLGFPFADRCAHLRSSNETLESPTFLLFLDCLWQVVEQFPCAFEFNTQFLEIMFFHLHSGLYGSFLMNNDKQRRASLVRMETISLWTAINEDAESYHNPFFAEVSTALLPVVTPYTVRLWEEVYLRHQPEFFPRSQAREQWARDQLQHLTDLQTDFSSRSGGSSRPSSSLGSSSRPSSSLLVHGRGVGGRSGSNGHLTEELVAMAVSSAAEGTAADLETSALRARTLAAEQRANELQQKLEVLEFCVKQQKSEAKSARRERRRTHTTTTSSSASPRRDTASTVEKSKRKHTRSSQKSHSLNRKQVASLQQHSASASASASATAMLDSSTSSEGIASLQTGSSALSSAVGCASTDTSESEHES